MLKYAPTHAQLDSMDERLSHLENTLRESFIHVVKALQKIEGLKRDEDVQVLKNMYLQTSAQKTEEMLKRYLVPMMKQQERLEQLMKQERHSREQQIQNLQESFQNAQAASN